MKAAIFTQISFAWHLQGISVTQDISELCGTGYLFSIITEVHRCRFSWRSYLRNEISDYTTYTNGRFYLIQRQKNDKLMNLLLNKPADGILISGRHVDATYTEVRFASLQEQAPYRACISAGNTELHSWLQVTRNIDAKSKQKVASFYSSTSHDSLQFAKSLQAKSELFKRPPRVLLTAP